MKKWQSLVLDVVISALSGWWSKRKDKKEEVPKDVDKTPENVV